MDAVMRAGALTCLVSMLAGCAAQGNIVRCDGQLEPINAPAPHEVQAAAENAGNEAELRLDHE